VHYTLVSEDAGPNTLVATVLAKDPDGDGITYSLTAGNEEGNFVIDSQKGFFSQAQSSCSRRKSIILLCLRKAAQWTCQQYQERASVLENQPAGTLVMPVQATDADEGANGKARYGLMHRDSATVPPFRVHPDTASCAWPLYDDDDFGTNAAISYSMSLEEPEYLRVNPVTGWVYVNQPISQRTYITREVVATDGGNRSTSVEMAVTITNVKNQPPHWETDSYSVVVPENTARDTPIVVSAVCLLIHDVMVLLGGLIGPHHMAVVVPDVNDNVPFFTSSVYEASLPEGAQRGTLVVQVSSHDRDLGLNGQVMQWRGDIINNPMRSHTSRRSNIEPPLVEEMLLIPSSSLLLSRPQLVVLTDRDSAYVRVFISGVNDNKPVLVQRLYQVAVDEKADVGVVMVTVRYQVAVDEKADVGLAMVTVSANDQDDGMHGNVTATDPDQDADQGAIRYSIHGQGAIRYSIHGQGAIRYSIHGQGAESHFMINDMTGEMYAQRSMNRKERAPSGASWSWPRLRKGRA
ncbi:hypothetical protein NHX12_002443, partial [Muraenolepis orangiensis]